MPVLPTWMTERNASVTGVAAPPADADVRLVEKWHTLVAWIRFLHMRTMSALSR
jgi:hypothetical protein